MNKKDLKKDSKLKNKTKPKNNKEKSTNNNNVSKPSTILILRYNMVVIIVIFILTILLPILLNYPPGSINTAFDIEMSYISFYQQFSIIGVLIMVLITFFLKYILKDIDLWYIDKNNEKFKNKKVMDSIRKKCFNLPYLIFLFMIIIPIMGVFFVLAITGSHSSTMIMKILILVFSFAVIFSVFSFILSKSFYKKLLMDTFEESTINGLRLNLVKTMFLLLFPLFIVGIAITSLIGYSRTVVEKENLLFQVYSEYLNSNFEEKNIYTESEILDILNKIPSSYSKTTYFIIREDGSELTSNNIPLSNFMKNYTMQLSDNYDGRTYESYGIDIQGSSIKISADNGTFIIGIQYETFSFDTINFFIVNFAILIALLAIVLLYFSKSLSTDLTYIANSLRDISNNDDIKLNKKIPLYSNDEIGDLILSFNMVQEKTLDYMSQIESNQDLLMEKERLASLGQLIGGIAHNLKTPIMSLSGVAEALTDLIKEYSLSIDDPEIDSKDHHDIANDMSLWVNKMKTYTEYMSDVITAVKGQAVALSTEEKISFTIDELIKRVNILMKHELQNALVKLDTNINVDSSISLNGDVNTLVQVINNMISNGIQSYNGAPNQKIDLFIEKDKNSIIISIQDYGSGMSQEIQSKLFKQMITTKGKNGTGLGMYMSYSTIRAHFNGNITFTSEESKGTKFNIILPI